jgi:hypothetical protein
MADNLNAICELSRKRGSLDVSQPALVHLHHVQKYSSNLHSDVSTANTLQGIWALHGTECVLQEINLLFAESFDGRTGLQGNASDDTFISYPQGKKKSSI